jgi:hypothetical protein
LKLTAQGIRDLNDPPRNARTRNDVAVPPAKATRCNHTYRDVRDAWGHRCEECIGCGHIRGERTGRGFR